MNHCVSLPRTLVRPLAPYRFLGSLFELAMAIDPSEKLGHVPVAPRERGMLTEVALSRALPLGASQ